MASSAPKSVHVLRVSFEPSARTAWHTHPFGQTLHILSGVARLQKSGEPITEAYPGDTVWIEAGERHWHGASAERSMVHIAIQQTNDENIGANWEEHVSDKDYGNFRKLG
jgi:quercetin dioxygenase-like cupin family protein